MHRGPSGASWSLLTMAVVMYTIWIRLSLSMYITREKVWGLAISPTLCVASAHFVVQQWRGQECDLVLSGKRKGFIVGGVKIFMGLLFLGG